MSEGVDVVADLRRLAPDLAPSLADELWSDLVAAHAGAQRRYHTLQHARHVRDDVVLLSAEAGIDEPAVAIAAWYHDAVYEGQSGDDERRSADLAAAVVTRIGRVDLAERVRELILVTIDHRPADDAAAVLVDADLAVLAAPPLDYERYRRRVRSEYGHVGDADWRRGRAGVLGSLLGRDRLFHSPGGRRREPTARRNLLTELARIS